MKKLLNTLYVTSENSYLGLDGEGMEDVEASRNSRERIDDDDNIR